MPWAPGAGVGPSLVEIILLAVKVFNDCKAAPQEVILDRTSLGTSKPGLWDKFRFPKKEIIEIRQNLLLNYSTLNGFLAKVSLRQHGRLSQDVKNFDKKIDAVPEAVVDSLVDAVNLLALRTRIGSPEDNTLVDHMNDTNQVWENFLRELEAEGSTSQTILDNKEPIMEHIKEFITYDMLESESEIYSHTEPDSIECHSYRPRLDESGHPGNSTSKNSRWLYPRSTGLPSHDGTASRLYSYGLLEAAAAGNLDIVKHLLHAGCDIESTSTMLGHHLFGTTGLYRAVSASHFDVARYLLENAANVNTFVTQKYGVTKPVLFVAIEQHDVEMTRLLLEYDARLSNIEDSISALQVVIDQNDDVVLLELVLTYCAHTFIDRVNNSGETALHLAAWRNNFAFVKCLLKKGARTNILCQNGRSALHRAAGNGHVYMVRDLQVHEADPKLGKVRMRERVLKEANITAGLDVFNELLSAGAGKGTSYR
ncbi:hypothetical protein MMC17_004421 [Xylographa soralifera]|nr:hypothetical protein [Xylographa soralifera]